MSFNRAVSHPFFSSTPNGTLPSKEKSPALIDEQCLISLSHLVEEKYRERTSATSSTTYSNFHVKIPFPLTSYLFFHDEEKIYEGIWSHWGISSMGAINAYIEFMQQYNLALLKFFEAINGSEAAEAEFKDFFQGNVMFNRAGIINKEYLNDSIKRPGFMLALLSYLLLDVVFSQNEGISVAGKIAAINLVKKHFNITACAKAFQDFRNGYEYECQLPGLLPKKFMDNIAAAFKIDEANKEILIKESVDLLIVKHPHEAAQAILSLLIMDDNWTCAYQINKALLFEQVINLANITNEQLKINIFGAEASYRNGGNSPLDLKQWAIEITNIPNIEDYVDLKKLAMLSDQPARELLLEYVSRNYMLETQLVEFRANAKSKEDEIQLNGHANGYANGMGCR